MSFENDFIVNRRKLLWFYMDEIKNDEFLHKYIYQIKLYGVFKYKFKY